VPADTKADWAGHLSLVGTFDLADPDASTPGVREHLHEIPRRIADPEQTRPRCGTAFEGGLILNLRGN